MIYHDGRHLFCLVVEVVTLTLPNEAVFFYFGKLANQQTLSPLHNWFYIDFLGAKVELTGQQDSGTRDTDLRLRGINMVSACHEPAIV